MRLDEFDEVKYVCMRNGVLGKVLAPCISRGLETYQIPHLCSSCARLNLGEDLADLSYACIHLHMYRLKLIIKQLCLIT